MHQVIARTYRPQRFSEVIGQRHVTQTLQNALRLLTRSKLNTSQAVELIRAEIPACQEVEELIAFIQSSERGVIK